MMTTSTLQINAALVEEEEISVMNSTSALTLTCLTHKLILLETNVFGTTITQINARIQTWSHRKTPTTPGISHSTRTSCVAHATVALTYQHLMTLVTMKLVLVPTPTMEPWTHGDKVAKHI
jgi:hypothetical protein